MNSRALAVPQRPGQRAIGLGRPDDHHRRLHVGPRGSPKTTTSDVMRVRTAERGDGTVARVAHSPHSATFGGYLNPPKPSRLAP
jgi:hypothetical protein